MTPVPDGDELGTLMLPSYGIRRIQAAVVGDPALAHVTQTLIDVGRPAVDRYVEAILAFDPDLIGISIYVWSTACLIAVAREVKRRRPSIAIVFGGPSARTALFDLEPHAPAGQYLDAIVEGEGEATFRAIAALDELTSQRLGQIPGVTVPAGRSWTRAAPRAPEILDAITSPFELGLMPTGGVAYLETYRGCPLSCRFCEWGSTTNAKAAFSTDYLVREMEAFRRNRAPAVFLLDAGLNLNARAFRNLREANSRSGFLRDALFWAEIYPSVVRDEHLEFLGEVGSSYLGVGMQSMDPAVLRAHDRPTDSPRFEASVRQLAAVTNIELQIIAGLPGDTPEGFRRTLAYARSLPAAVRVYHCLVLPDALLTRSRPEWNVRFDLDTLAIRSCEGWSEAAIAGIRRELDAATRAIGGKAGRFWWSFPRLRAGTARAAH